MPHTDRRGCDVQGWLYVHSKLTERVTTLTLPRGWRALCLNCYVGRSPLFRGCNGVGPLAYWAALEGGLRES